MGRSGYYCYGTLKPVERNIPMTQQQTDGAALRDAVRAMAAIDPATAVAAEKIRAAAAVNLAHAEAKLREAMSDLKRATTRIGKWHAKTAYYSKRVSVTNIEVQVERTRRTRKD